MKTVVFVWDYVMHYHRELLRAVETKVTEEGGRFVLITARHEAAASGRVPLEVPVVQDQRHYSLYERTVRGFTLRNQRGVVSMVRSLAPDIVVTMCHTGTWSDWRLALLKRTMGYKLVAWQCGYEYNPGLIKDAALSLFIPMFDHHLAYHTNAKHYAMKYGAAASQVTVMHNTINEQRVELTERGVARQQVEARFPSLKDAIIVLYVGAVLQEKRLETVIDAMDRLGDPRLRFLVVGNGPHLAALQARCAGRDDVIFAGRVVDGVGPYFDAADVFVLPGTGGLAVNEAMIHGLPIIAGYGDGSIDDLVQDGVNGYRLRTGDAAELAGRLQLLAGDSELRARKGAASRELITTRFAFAGFSQRVTSLLTSL